MYVKFIVGMMVFFGNVSNVVFELESVGCRGIFGNGWKGGICMMLVVVIGLEMCKIGGVGWCI